MFAVAAYIFVVFLEFVFLIAFIVFTVFLIYSSLKGAPYVPTNAKEADFILKAADLKKGQFFVELGSGDGRLIRKAVKDYGVKGLGIDVNPLLILYSKVLANYQGLRNAKFERKDVFQTDLRNADVIYLFLMPALLEKISFKMKKELKKRKLIVSHGFPLDAFKENLIKTIHHKPFPTYFYRT